MKAAILTHYNAHGASLLVKDIATPTPADDEVLVQIKTAGVNPLDNMIIRGEVKLIVPYKTPLVMGNEFAGVVCEVGKNVTDFAPGDRVYGRMPLDKIGAFAEYAAVKASALAIIPDYLSDEAAATVPLTALTALQAYELMAAHAGESLFISGGTGSLGAMAIPIAKRLGLRVFTNGSAANAERVIGLGVEKFIDYRKENYTDVLPDVDHVLDTLGERELENEFRVLKPGGSLVSLRGLPNGRFAKRMGMPAAKQLLFKIAGRKYDKLADAKGQTYDFLFVHEDGKGLSEIGRLFDKDHPLETAVDTVYTLDEVGAALAKVDQGHSLGKTILKISD